MARRRDPQTGKLLPEGIHPQVSDRTGVITYRARISYGPRRHRRHIGKTFKHVESAIDWLLQTQMEVNQGTAIEPRQVTCDQYFRIWFGRKSREVSSSRSLSLKHAWRHYGHPVIGDVKVQSVRQWHIQQIVDELERIGRARSSINLYMIGFRAMFAAAINDGIISTNPCADIVIAPAPRKDKTIWTPAQLRKFLASEKGSPLYPLWAFMIGTSCRIGEALALQWGDIDLEGQTVWIRRTVIKDQNGATALADRTKSGEEGRVLALEGWLVEILKTIPNTHELVFNDVFDYRQHSRINVALRKACARAKLPPITAHGLRHATATAMALNGVEESVVQEILGHRSRETTRKIYIHVNMEAKRRGSTSLAQLLGQMEADSETLHPDWVR